MTIRIGICGTGFGRRGLLLALRHVEGAEAVAVYSRTLAHAKQAAEEFGIPQYFDDYEEMLSRAAMDLVAVIAPVHLHYPITMKAIEAGVHVLCEKPMALNTGQCAEMAKAARQNGLTNVIDHELRFEPNRRLVKKLLDDNYIGRPYHIVVYQSTSNRADATQPAWDWWSDADKGGGGLGASGSHIFDLLRWWFGEITALAGQTATWVERRLSLQTNGMLPVTSDDQWSVIAELTGGVLAALFETRVMRHPSGPQLAITGSEGTLILDREERLWGARTGESLHEMTVRDPHWGAPGLPLNIYSVSLVSLMRELVDAISQQREPRGTASFKDGMYCQAVIDALRLSWQERHWVKPLDLLPADASAFE